MDLVAGKLLVATPSLTDPRFVRSVVLLLEAGPNGALGVVLNQPLGEPVPPILAEWSDLLTGGSQLFRGGPVEGNGALAVARAGEDEPVGWRKVFDDVGILDLDTPVELVDGALAGMRIFAGYAGWSPDQLESEIETQDWVVVDSLPHDAFTDAPDRLWSDVLRRQGGWLALIASAPVDVSLN